MSSSLLPNLFAGHSDAERSLAPAETIQACGCLIVLRRVAGSEARELFFSCQPMAGIADAGAQAEAIYRAVLNVLIAEGGSFASVVSEIIFHRNLRENIAPVRAARQRVVATGGDVTLAPAVTEIEQPPLNGHAWLELSVQAVLPINTHAIFEPVVCEFACGCAECARAQGLVTRIGDETRFYSGLLYGNGADAYEQTSAMFSVAQKMLQKAGMQFGDVVRTWIYLREMDRDYASLNRARREFFDEHGISPAPASTGIGAGLVPEGHDLCLSVYAVKSKQSLQRTLMTTPTLNEAPLYGADFSRGMRVAHTKIDALYISGTASIDETGKSVHVGDFEAQVDRMLLNVAALLKAQGASFGDIVSAITYLKYPADADRLTQKLQQAGYEGFGNTLVVAPVCRPELLCETEALAILSKKGSNKN